MNRRPIKLNIETYPEAIADYLKDAELYDSSSSPQATVTFINKDEGYFLKEAAEGTLKTEALMMGYLHSLGLSGEVRAVSMAEQRVLEAKKLGFHSCVVPAVCLKGIKNQEGIKIIGVKSVRDAIDLI